MSDKITIKIPDHAHHCSCKDISVAVPSNWEGTATLRWTSVSTGLPTEIDFPVRMLTDISHQVAGAHIRHMVAHRNNGASQEVSE